MPQRRIELLERLKKSSQRLEEAFATLSASRNDLLGLRAPLEEFLARLFRSKSTLFGSRERLLESKSRREESLERRSCFFAPLVES